ncbi:hypothetical protein FIBSPDRAFT_939074 [Athelia psychrophila]|uniref:Uncharacterized protein n=1 Tax=Athelia psychrophila TaxID=1759441 RepID=A0A165X7S6_9AGAM|nr:hypothetical protein FIBSPDRAFT_939074 [Fibularhizoctonia sp. CBS 109695]
MYATLITITPIIPWLQHNYMLSHALKAAGLNYRICASSHMGRNGTETHNGIKSLLRPHRLRFYSSQRSNTMTQPSSWTHCANGYDDDESLAILSINDGQDNQCFELKMAFYRGVAVWLR